MEGSTRWLYAAAIILLLMGLGLRIVPAPVRGAEPRASSDGAPVTRTRRAADRIPVVDSVIAGGNVFSASRSPPRVRFIPPDLALPKQEPPRGGRPAPTRLRLFGTVVGPSGTAALIDADPVVRGAEIYEVGDLVDGRRVVAVSESTVVLDGAAGRLVLRLQSAPQPTP